MICLLSVPCSVSSYTETCHRSQHEEGPRMICLLSAAARCWPNASITGHNWCISEAADSVLEVFGSNMKRISGMKLILFFRVRW
jgi:hypothetical protein